MPAKLLEKDSVALVTLDYLLNPRFQKPVLLS